MIRSPRDIIPFPEINNLPRTLDNIPTNYHLESKIGIGSGKSKVYTRITKEFEDAHKSSSSSDTLEPNVDIQYASPQAKDIVEDFVDKIIVKKILRPRCYINSGSDTKSDTENLVRDVRLTWKKNSTTRKEDKTFVIKNITERTILFQPGNFTEIERSELADDRLVNWFSTAYIDEKAKYNIVIPLILALDHLTRLYTYRIV